MKVLETIKSGILSGNWQQICDAYKFATGEELSPPITEPIIKTDIFDPYTANKRSLYKWINERRPLENKIKEYDTTELRELAILLFENENQLEDSDLINTVDENNFNILPSTDNSMPFFINKDVINEGDKIRAESMANLDKVAKADVQMKDLLKTPENKKTDKTYRPKFEKISAQCKKCNNVVMVSPSVVDNTSGTARTICEACMGKR